MMCSEMVENSKKFMFNGREYVTIGMEYVGDEYVANMRLRHEQIPDTVYQHCYCKKDGVANFEHHDGVIEIEMPKYEVAIRNGKVMDVKKYDYEVVTFRFCED